MSDPIASRAFWTVAPGRGEIRDERLAPPGPGELLLRSRFGAISRGTETLVFRGEVPDSERERMRAPFQRGDFPHPVHYGYVNVSEVIAGDPALVGRTVFALLPHATHHVVPADAVTVLPEDVPAERAVLAANLETAVNACWDAAPRIGDRIAVVGGGAVGCLVAWLCGRLPGARVELVDVDPGRARAAAALGVGFASPEDAAGECDVVFHASGSGAGLGTAISLAGFEATVTELSWYGTREVAVPLGGAFHSRRLTVAASQVGHVAGARRARRGHADRLTVALGLAAEPALDVLVDREVAFEGLPHAMAGLARGGAGCVRVTYGRGADRVGGT